MTAFNVVRLKVKPGHEADFIDVHRKAEMAYPGFRHGALVKTGDRSYCFIGEWNDFASIVEARPEMIAFLDTFRGSLEDLGDELGVTDAVSGEVALELKP